MRLFLLLTDSEVEAGFALLVRCSASALPVLRLRSSGLGLSPRAAGYLPRADVPGQTPREAGGSRPRLARGGYPPPDSVETATRRSAQPSAPGLHSVTTSLGDSLRLFFIFGLVRTKTKGSFCPRRIVSLACITADDGSDGGIQFFEPDPRSQHRPLRPGGAPQVPRVPRKQDTATTARTLRVLQSQS